MANLILAILIFLIIFLVIAEAVSVRITYTNELIIRIELLLLTVILYPSRRDERKKRKKKDKLFKKLRKRTDSLIAIRRALDFLFRQSSLTVHEINLELDSYDPSKYAPRAGGVSTLILILLTYLSGKLGAIWTEDSRFVSSKSYTAGELPRLDLTLKTTLISALLSIFVFAVEKIKRTRRKKEIV